MKIITFSFCVMMILLSSAFNAQCNAINVPYSENFNSSLLPPCTSTQVISGGTEWQAHLGGLYIGDTNANPNSWFYTRGFNLQAGNVYKITFDYSGNYFPQSFAVAYGTAQADTSMTNVIQEFPNIPNNTAPVLASITFSPSATGVYYFGFNYKGGNPGTLLLDNLSITLQSTLSASEVRHLKDNVEVYPNPVKDYLFIKNAKKNAGTEILDVSGKLVLSLTGIKEKIDVSQLIRGTYFLVIKNEDGTLSKTKFIKR